MTEKNNKKYDRKKNKIYDRKKPPPFWSGSKKYKCKYDRKNLLLSGLDVKKINGYMTEKSLLFSGRGVH